MNIDLKIITNSQIINAKAEAANIESNLTDEVIKLVGSDILPTELKEIVLNTELKEATDPENLPENLSGRMNDVALDTLPEKGNDTSNSSLFLSLSNFVMSKIRSSSPAVKTTEDKEKSIEECLKGWVVLDVEDSDELEVKYDEDGYIINPAIDEEVLSNQISIDLDEDDNFINDEDDNLLIEEASYEEPQVVELDANGKEIEETKEEKKLRKSKEAAVTKIMVGASGIGGVVASTGIGGITVETIGGIWVYSQTAKNSYMVSSRLLQYFVANSVGTGVSAVANVSILGVSVVTLGNAAAIGTSVYLGAKLGQWGYNKIFTEKEEEKINITSKTIVTSIAGKVLGS
jgi:hypothetical protein